MFAILDQRSVLSERGGMMASVKGYLLSVICGTIVCSLVGSLTDKKGSMSVLLKLISGLYLVFTVISPVTSLEVDEFSIFTDNLQQKADAIAALGLEYSRESASAYIKAETEAYILDKATVLNASVLAEVSLNEDMQPESVILTGDISDYAQFRLETILEEDLGISKENQQWKESCSS